MRARRGGERTAEDGCDGPAEILDALEEAVRLRELLRRDQVRQPRSRGGLEETGREPGDRGERDDGGGVRRERQRDEDRRTSDVGPDHQRAAREPVDQRPQREPDDDRRRELDHHQGRDPKPRMRPVVDVDGQRDRGEERPHARAERGEEQQAESRIGERAQLTAEQGRRRVPPFYGF